MNIFICNADDRVSESSMRKFFRPKLKEYHIEVFECRKLASRGCFIITVLDAFTGSKFIKWHEHRRDLVLHSRQIFVREGRELADPHALKSLQKRQRDLEDNRQSLAAREPEDTDYTSKVAFWELSCGAWATYTKSPTYISHFRELLSGTITFGEKSLTIATPDIDMKSLRPVHRIDVQYSSVESIATGQYARHENELTLTIALNVAPKVYLLELDKLSYQPGNRKYVRPIRVHGISLSHQRAMANGLVYQVRLKDLESLFACSKFLDAKKTLPKTIHGHYRSDHSLTTSFHGQMESLNTSLSSLHGFDFALKFQLQKLAQNNYLEPARVEELLPLVIDTVRRHGLKETTYAVKRLFNNVPYASLDVGNEAFDLEGLGSLIDLDARDSPVDTMYSLVEHHENLALVHKVFVTPTGIYLEGPAVENKNRVLRKYSGFVSSHFLRVAFIDEDGRSIQYDRVGSLDSIHQKFKESLRGSIKIAGRCFKFLGFSNSSLRDQSCWYMAEFTCNGSVCDARSVVRDLGDFSHIRSPAKCAARIGQAFTDTPYGITSIDRQNVKQIPDVELNGRVFSDGCGTISPAVAKRLWKNYPGGVKPTLFQIRYAGAKGMLSIDNRLDGEVMCIRPSMEKFEGKHTDIEICGSSRRALPFYLNRQIIKVLEDLGVRVKSFLDLQSKAVKELQYTTLHAVNASNFLERNDIGPATQVHWLIKNIHYAKIPVLKDRFLRQCVEHIVITSLRNLKHRARIPVAEAVTLYGIMDETGELTENQIFARKDGTTLTGPMSITRSPALHPGDVQTVVAVGVSANSLLRRLDNCVVFSRWGTRDLPSQLSGGDLDGDIFNLIYEKTLQPSTTVVAADYPRVPPIDIKRPVEVGDITDFFVNFMANDQLSRIANSHLQASDLIKEGTQSDTCKTLAGLHSTAVDFQKTGIPVNMSHCPKLRPYKPDFMAPSPRLLKGLDRKMKIVEDAIELSDDEEDTPEDAINPDRGRRRPRFYESDKALGQLYRAIDEQEFLNQLQNSATTDAAEGIAVMIQLYRYVRKHTKGIQWRHLKDWAQDVKHDYEELMSSMQTTYGSRWHPLTEVEVFTGTILGNEDGSLPSHRLRETTMTMKDVFQKGVGQILNRITGRSEGEVDPQVARDEALERSIACFRVSLEDQAGSSGKNRLVSFRYVAGMACLREVEAFKKSVKTIDDMNMFTSGIARLQVSPSK